MSPKNDPRKYNQFATINSGSDHNSQVNYD